jgi:hypothetical protein
VYFVIHFLKFDNASMMLNFSIQMEGTGGFGIWSAFYDQATQCGHSCDMTSPTQSHPTPNHPQIPKLTVVWITGPATDPSLTFWGLGSLVCEKIETEPTVLMAFFCHCTVMIYFTIKVLIIVRTQESTDPIMCVFRESNLEQKMPDSSTRWH